jgi:hypothetical protein
MTTTITEPAKTTTPALDAETRRVLATAKGILANGWCQGSYTNDKGRHCLVGALLATGATYRATLDAENALIAIVDDAVECWNDAPGLAALDGQETE